jgi:ribosomal protein S18 acetylase RimI-like enzyme
MRVVAHDVDTSQCARGEGLPVCIRPLVEADRASAARIYVSELRGEEVWPCLPCHQDRAEAIFAELITPSCWSWIAEADGHGAELIGVALCQEPPGSHPSMVNWGVLRRNLPLPAAVRAWIVGNYLYRVRLDSDTIYLQSLAVAHQWQRRGVGGALVHFVCDEARQRGYRKVSLNVVDRNRGARRLYHRLGFSRVHTSRTGLFRLLVGFGAMDLMEKLVAGSEEAGGEPIWNVSMDNCSATQQL